ncbi:hypothetical protein [Thioclava sp. JM3]|nr:hypothetical protein [Thioclava sp. JM3]
MTTPSRIRHGTDSRSDAARLMAGGMRQFLLRLARIDKALA